MSLTSRFALAVLSAAVVAGALTACSGIVEPEPTEIAGAGADSSAEQQADSEQSSPAGSSGDAFDQAANDGMPGLGLVGCDQLDDYEYLPTSGNTQWHFVFTCMSRDAYDGSAAALVAAGYEASPLVISEGDYVSERTYLQADANGGSTEVQLNLVGSPDELEFEIYVTLTLP
jgi:hypothetical protein